jgi:hypothetical protein
MDGDGDPAEPDDPAGGVTPPAAFFGLWPKFGEREGRMNSLQQPHEVRLRGLPAAVLRT